MLLCTAMLLSCVLHAQQFELGFDMGYWGSNIADPNSPYRDHNIGKNFSSFGLGISALYMFKNPASHLVPRIKLLYRNHTKGSISFWGSDEQFQIPSHTLGILGGIAIADKHDWFMYLDMGLGLNLIEPMSTYYVGRRTQTTAFYDLANDFEVKNRELLFLLDVGVEKNILKNKLNLVLHVGVEVGITPINEDGQFYSHAYSFGLGLRYIINYRPNAYMQHIYYGSSPYIHTPIPFHDNTVPSIRTQPVAPPPSVRPQ